MSNEDDQSDELMAMKSIYGEDVFICDAIEKPYNGSIIIDVELESKEHDFLRNGEVMMLKHITPVVLNFSLPSSYPSESPPDFDISCLWLTTQQIEHLSNILKDKWKENCGAVIYIWMDLIKTEMFGLLNLKYPLEISDGNLLNLIEINQMREEEIFQNSDHFCPVCFTDMPGPECIRLSDCGHVLCRECLSGFLSFHIFEGNVKFLFCPVEDCEDSVDTQVIKSLVSETDFERYDRLLLQNTLDVMSDVIYCPRKNCNKPVIVEGDDRTGFCYSCKFAFCTRCKLTYHGIEPCKFEKRIVWRRRNVDEPPPFKSTQPRPPKPSQKIVHSKSESRHADYMGIPEDEMARIGKEYLNGSGEIKAGYDAFFGKKVMKDLIGDYKSSTWKGSYTQKCPGCKASIEKNKGCNHMTCSNCKRHFTWTLTID